MERAVIFLFSSFLLLYAFPPTSVLPIEKMLSCCMSACNRNSQPPPETALPPNLENPTKPKPKEEILLRIPSSTAHLIEDGEPLELAKGDFTLVRLIEDNVALATIVRIGADLRWPLTKDEPVVKLDELRYLFSLPCEDGEVLSYAISFSEQNSSFTSLDSFLKENSCFSIPSSSPNTTTAAAAATTSSSDPTVLYWKDYAPRIEDYNGVLAKAIARGTGEIVKGIFKCTNTYIKQVQKGGEIIRAGTTEDNNRGSSTEVNQIGKNKAGEKKSGVQKGIKRVRKLSKMTEKMSRSLLNRVTLATGSVAAPLVRSKAGKAFLAMAPGEVLLASLDALNKVMDAVEAAEKEAFTATSGAAKRIVFQRFGESAGEVMEDVFATAGHAAGAAWNIFKIRKAIKPTSSVPSATVKKDVKKKH